MSPLRPLRPWLVATFYVVSTLLVRVLARLFARFEVRGRANVPADGGVILIANHLHLADPPLVMAAAPRRVHPMAKRELFETPLVGWVFWAVGAFPVRRYSADIGALRAARNILRGGDAVLIFPEGTRSKAGGLQPALPGAATVALLSGSPIVPVAITGTEAVRFPGLFLRALSGRRPTVRIEFGEPFTLPVDLSEASQAMAASDFIMRRVAALLPERYRGAYGAGSEDTLVYRRSEVRPVAPPRRH